MIVSWVTMTMTKSSAILTRCSAKSEPSGPDYISRAREHTRQLVTVTSPRHIITDNYFLPRMSNQTANISHISPTSKHNRQLVYVTITKMTPKHRTNEQGTDVLVFGLAAKTLFTFIPFSFKRLKQNKQFTLVRLTMTAA
jgi:hypothetical protein